MTPCDRVTGSAGTPAPGWSGRWFADHHVLDPATGVPSRDLIESDDLDALATLRDRLDQAVNAQSWLELLDVPLLAGHDDASLSLTARELALRSNIASVAHVCEHFITRLGERTELLPVSRVRRPARRALQRLAGHTEDWAGRTLSGPVPRRALAVTREDDADLYENRMVTELVHPILTASLAGRIRRLGRVTSDLADLERTRDEGTYRRRERLYRFWGEDSARAAESSSRAAETLLELEKLSAWLQLLRGSTLISQLRGRRTGQRTLRVTNVVANDRHYRSAGLVWTAYEREVETPESLDQRAARLGDRHRSFDTYVLGLLTRSLDDLGYSPDDDAIPAPGTPLLLRGPWGPTTLTRGIDGSVELVSAKRSRRFVPLVDLVAPDDDDEDTADRWRSTETGLATVLVYLAPSTAIRRLPTSLASEMLSGGPDQLERPARTGVPVSPLETTSLERVARAVAVAVLAPQLETFPEPVHLDGARLPRRLIEAIAAEDLTSPGASPLLHRDGPDTLSIRRAPTPQERARLDALIARLADRSKGIGWERDVAHSIDALTSAIERAADRVARFMICPACTAEAQPVQVTRHDDVFSITCRSCSCRWGLERCGSCGSRVPIIEPDHKLHVEVAGPGWVERVHGRDALSSPCWVGTVPGRFICPHCRGCSVSDSPLGDGCVRCHPDRV